MVGKLAIERVVMGEHPGQERCIDLCAAGALHYLGVGDTPGESGENPRIISVLTSMLERALLERKDSNKELVSTKSYRNYTSKYTYISAKNKSWFKASINESNSHQGGDNAKINTYKQKLSVFDGIRAPSIGIESYLQRINKYARCSPCCFVLAYAYICKLLSACLVDNLLISTQLVCNSLITSFNIHRLLITSIMLAAKFMDDSHYNNAYFAKIGGVSTVEINGLEMAFLKLIGYRLHINLDCFERLCSQIVQEFATATLARLPTSLHIQCCTLPCSFDEEEDRKVALKCTQCSGVRISPTSGAFV